MRKVLFDTNIILDIALKRNVFFEHASELFGLIDRRVIIGNVTASSITDIYYISKKESGLTDAKNFIKNLVEVVEVIRVDKRVILNALDSDIKDLEDAVQISASELNEIEIIITRNKSDFANTLLSVMTPQEFLSELNYTR